MSKFLLSVDWDSAQSLLISILKDNLDNLRNDWDKVYKEKRGYVFSADYEEDISEISAHISAIKKIIRYHGGNPE